MTLTHGAPEPDNRYAASYGGLVPLWECALWGLFGGAAVEGLEWAAVMRRTGGWPWGRRRRARSPILASVVIRLGVGAGLAAALGASGPMSALSALGAGVAAPLIIEKLAQQVPVALSQPEARTEAAAAPAELPTPRTATPARQESGTRDTEVTDAT